MILRISVEVHSTDGMSPGSVDAKRHRLGEIAVGEIASVAISDASPHRTYAVSDYEVTASVRKPEGGVEVEQAVVYAHRREDGWQRLAERALRALQQGSLRVRAPTVAACEEGLSALHEMFSGLTTEGKAKHGGDFADVERLLQWLRVHGPAHDEGAELMRLREVIRAGGAMYRLERAALGFPGGVDAELATCRTCGERSKFLEPYCVVHRPGASREESSQPWAEGSKARTPL